MGGMSVGSIGRAKVSVSDGDLQVDDGTEHAARYTIAVRALCEFTAKTGDLDLRFTPSPTAQEGIAGHGVVTARRDDDYQTEIALSGDFGPLHVRGRADGYDMRANRLEEIKTYRGDLKKMPDNSARCTGRRSRSTAICYARTRDWKSCAWRWSISTSAARRKPCCTKTTRRPACKPTSSSNAACSWHGRGRRWRIARPATCN
jgi:hypothetical protein